MEIKVKLVDNVTDKALSDLTNCHAVSRIDKSKLDKFWLMGKQESQIHCPRGRYGHLPCQNRRVLSMAEDIP